MIYFGAETQYFYALNPDGTLAWRYQIRTENNAINWSSPAIANDGTIYIGNNYGDLLAFKSVSLGLINSPWPKIHYNNQNTGRK